MTRHALLISNPGELGAENYCKGVFIDIQNYIAHFKSPTGGSWLSSEITYLSSPSVLDAKNAVKKLTYHDYSFVAFSGHGWYSAIDRCNVLTLSKDQDIASHELLVGAAKHTAIFDSCREIYNESISESNRQYEFMAKAAASTLRRPDPQRCREHFDQVISDASNGVIEVNSCDRGETAGDDPEQGGRYASSLFAVADAWAEDQTKSPSFMSKASLTMVGAHQPASLYTKRQSGNRQNPQISTPRTQKTYFPFAVFA